MGVNEWLSISDELTEDLVEELTRAFPDKEWRMGPKVRLRPWMPYFFAFISGDWNRIHFRRAVPFKHGPEQVAHGTMLNCLLPRLAAPCLQELHHIASGSSRVVVDSSSTCKFMHLCPSDATIYARLRRRAIRKELLSIFISFEFEIVATWRTGNEEVVQSGTRMLCLLKPS